MEYYCPLKWESNFIQYEIVGSLQAEIRKNAFFVQSSILF